MEGIRRRVAEKKAKGLYGVDALMADGSARTATSRSAGRARDAARAGGPASGHRRRAVHQAGGRRRRLAGEAPAGARREPADVRHVGPRHRLQRVAARLPGRARPRGRGAGAAGGGRPRRRRRGRAEVAALRDELSEALRAVGAARAQVARLADAALPERVARLERGPAVAGPPRAAPGPAGASGSLSLRLEATEEDAGRGARLAAHAGGARRRRASCTRAPAAAGRSRRSARGPRAWRPTASSAAAAAGRPAGAARGPGRLPRRARPRTRSTASW